MQLVQLRHRAVCAVCASKLPPRAEAWLDEAASRTVCLTCYRVESASRTAVEALAEGAHPAQPTAPAQPIEPAQPSGSLGADTDRVPPPRQRVKDGARDVAPASEAARRNLNEHLDQALADQERAKQAHVEAEQAQRERAQRVDQVEAEKAEMARQARLVAAAEALEREASNASNPNDARGNRSGADAAIHPPLLAEPPPNVGRRGRGAAKASRLPKVGPSLAAGVDVARQLGSDAKSTNAIARSLEAARSHGLEIINSRPWVGTSVESEAIVVGPSGVWVVDGLGDTDVPVAKGFLGGHAGSELLNVVGGRTSIISGLLFDSPYQWVPVRGALCFDSQVPPWFDAPFNLAGISITTPRELIDSLFMPLNLDADTRRKVAQHLVNRF